MVQRLCYTCPRVANESAAAAGPYTIGESVAGRYVLDALLGADSACAVYRARDTLSAQLVTLQVLHEPAPEPFSRARFERAVDAVCALAHPNIATILDRGVSAERSHLILEWLEGESLASRLRRGPLALAAGLAIVRQLLAALASMHAAGLVHGNLEPNSVFLQRRMHGERVKVRNFRFPSRRPGLVAEPARVAASTENTWRAPELAAGSAPDARSDIFAVGMLLSEIVAAKPLPGAPLLARTPLEPAPPALEPVVEPGAADAALAAALQGLIQRATLEQRKERFSDAAEMLCDLIDAMPRAPSVPASPDAGSEPPPSAEPTGPVLVDALLPSELDERAPGVSHPQFDSASQRPSTPAPPLARLRGSPRVAAALIGAGLAALALVSWLRSDPRRASWHTSNQPPAPAAALSDDPVSARARVDTETQLHAAIALPPPASGRSERTTAKDHAASSPPAASGAQPQHVASMRRSPARNPWLEPVPPELQGIPAYVETGAPGNEAILLSLRSYKRIQPNDPRGPLLLGRLYNQRLWRSDCLSEWTLALRRDPSARGAPELLPALIQLVMQDQAAEASAAAAELITSAYGHEALNAVDAALSPLRNTAAASRLRALRALLAADTPD